MHEHTTSQSNPPRVVCSSPPCHLKDEGTCVIPRLLYHPGCYQALSSILSLLWTILVPHSATPRRLFYHLHSHYERSTITHFVLRRGVKNPLSTFPPTKLFTAESTQSPQTCRQPSNTSNSISCKTCKVYGKAGHKQTSREILITSNSLSQVACRPYQIHLSPLILTQ